MASEDVRKRKKYASSPAKMDPSNPGRRTPALQKLPHSQPRTALPNIIIFGETGTGKSSIINMLADEEVAVTSNAVRGCTFDSKAYDIVVQGGGYRVWDTAGLNEGEDGTVPADKAWKNLQKLVSGLENGLNLLVYCIRGGRYRDIIEYNYNLFWRVICRRKVPIVLVVTGLENEEKGLHGWWDRNQSEFTSRDIKFDGIACITSCRGKTLRNGRPAFEKEYNQSVDVLRNLIKGHCPPQAWVIAEDRHWLLRIKREIVNSEAFSSRRQPEGRKAKFGTILRLLNCV